MVEDSFARKVKVPDATIVVVKTVETVDSGIYRDGQDIPLMVVMPVKIKGKVIIESGATAVGVVDFSKEADYAGIPGELSIAVKYVKAVDGTSIRLSGYFMDKGNSQIGGTVAVALLCPLAIINRGGEGTIRSGSELRAMTIGNYMIDVGQ